MTLADLIQQFRREAQDRVGPEYLWSDENVTALFNDAVDEAVVRRRLLHESSAGAVCRVNLALGRAQYPLHPALYELTYVAVQLPGDSCRQPLQLVSTEWLDDHVRDWRSRSGLPRYAVQGDTGLRLVPTPDSAATLLLEGYRLAMRRLEGDTDEPEIHQAHHRHLVHWVLHRCFSEPDADGFDPNRAAKAEAAFNQYFGLRPDADLRRSTREDVIQHVQAWP